MKTLFKYEKAGRASFWGVFRLKIICFPMPILALFAMGSNDLPRNFFGISIVLASFVVAFLAYKINHPKDRIIVTEHQLIVSIFKGKRVAIDLQDIGRIESHSSLIVYMKNGSKSLTISYSDWLLPMTKVSELISILERKVLIS